jgi:effector-binding domain-containing protein
MPSTPELKTIHPATFLFHRVETTVADLINQIPIGQKLFQAAVEQKLGISGPIHWHYFNFEGDHKPFILEVALPINNDGSDYHGQFQIKRTEKFSCVCITHEGPWNEIPGSYDKLVKFLALRGKTPSTTAREIYVNADFNNQEANVTEIQLGIQ